MGDHLHDREGSRLRIGRFRAQYVVAADHPAPDRVKARLDDSIAEWLSHALGPALAGALPATATDVWMIRRLHVDADVNVAWDRDDLMRVLADRIGDVLLRTIRGGADGRDVVWFPDRPAFLAGYLSDRADGRGNDWYYEPFAGLALLPVSAALRTAICEATETGLAAMHRLAPDAIRRVLAAMTVQDARTVLDAFAAAAPSGDPGRCIEVAWSALRGLAGGSLSDVEGRDALRLYLAAQGTGDASGRPLRDAARAVLRLDRLLRDSGSDRRAQLLSALTRTDPFALHLAAGASDAEVLAPWRSGRRDWVRTVVAELAARLLGPVDRTTAAPGSRRYTRFGGAFFILPMLDELPLDAATASWPGLDGIPAAALVRFLVLLKCLGAPRTLEAFHDGLLRDVMGIARDLTAGMCFEWQTRVSDADRDGFLEAIETWRVERGTLTLATQFLVRAAPDGRPVVVLLDGARGIWRRVLPEAKDRPTRVISRLRRVRDLSRSATRLLCDPALVVPIGLEFPDCRVTDVVDLAPDAEPEVRETATRLDRLQDDLESSTFPARLGITGPLDRALVVAAQGLLRSFAWRLPGFSRSSLAYLRANFLDVTATLEEQDGRRVILLGRPPLDVILNITGMNRGSYRLGWLDERPFMLFPEG